MQQLEETSRPTLYRTLKYWGKKPHNIWRTLINANTQKGGIVYDPFAGSALTFFEAIKIGRKPVIADINPLTLFLVDVYSRKYDYKKIINRFEAIKKFVSNTEFYKKNYTDKCSNCGSDIDIFNYRWTTDKQIAYSYKCSKCSKTITENSVKSFFDHEFKLWKPQFNIANFTSANNSSIKDFGGTDIQNIWTKRNLELLSLIYSLIIDSEDEIKTPLMFAFLQSVHLTTKMCALRSEKTNRPLSTSWGRPAYMFLKNRMEQNPLVQFERALFEKNGLIKSFLCRDNYLPRYSYSTNIDDLDKVDGIVCLKDSKSITDGFKAELVITDPPYGSIIQYGELSQIWNVWLENFNPIYKHSLKDEIIINKSNDYEKYLDDMTKILCNCNRILKDNGSIIMTFNSNNINDWHYINKAIEMSEFKIKSKYIQKNKRSSEANVKAVSDLAITDHYFVLEKTNAQTETELGTELIEA